MDESKQRKIGVVLSYASIIISTLVQLIYTPFMIRKLGQSEYGLYSLIASVIGYLTLFDLGFGNAIVVYTSKYQATNQKEKAKKMQGMFKVVFWIVGGIVAIAGIILYFNVENMFGKTMTSLELNKAKVMMLILTVNLVITFSFNIYSSVINEHERFVFQKIISIINTLLKPMIMIPLLLLGYKSIAMCLTITVVNIIVVLSNYYYCTKKIKIKIKFQGFDEIIFKEIFKYSIFIFINIIVDKINWSLDQFILGATSGTIAVSIYSVATNINTLFLNLSGAVSGILLPKVSKMVAKNASSNVLTEEMIKVGRLQWLIIFLMASGITLFGKEFFIWWAGIEYEESYYVALLLVIPACIPLIQNLGISIRQAMNKHQFAAYLNIVIAIFNAIISIFLAKKYGAVGAALGTAGGILLSSLIMNVFYCKAIKLDMIKFWKEIIKMTIPFCIPVFIITIIMKFIKIYGINGVLVYGSVYTIIYIIIAYVFSMNQYEKGIIKNFINHVNKKVIHIFNKEYGKV